MKGLRKKLMKTTELEFSIWSTDVLKKLDLNTEDFRTFKKVLLFISYQRPNLYEQHTISKGNEGTVKIKNFFFLVERSNFLQKAKNLSRYEVKLWKVTLET